MPAPARRGGVDPASPPLCLEPRSPSWPRELSEIDGPPERLWARGRLDLLARWPRLAIVGTRGPSPYGAAQAARFARELAAAGITIVSGMARGIDQVAHRAALDAGGSTIAVLGSGVDQPWPAGEIAEELARDGLLLSEFRPGTAPRPHHFPLRNRLISGLSCGVLVVEAAGASGSLITARWAADQGRQVWALPGRVDHPLSRGAHRLLREGAALVEAPEEIVRDILGAEIAAPDPSADPRAPAAREDGPLASAVLACLVGETLDAGEIAQRTGAPVGEVLSALVTLELDGRIARGPGGLYRRRE